MGISILFADGVFSRLLEGLLVSAEISLISALFSLVFGVIFGLFLPSSLFLFTDRFFYLDIFFISEYWLTHCIHPFHLIHGLILPTVFQIVWLTSNAA